MVHLYEDEKDDRGTVFLKYLLFMFNFLFWVGGTAVIAMGLWTLMEKSDYISLLATSTFSLSAYILLFAGSLVMITGFLGCFAMIREQKSCLTVYLSILILIYLMELAAGILSYVYYDMISNELRHNLNQTIIEDYAQPGKMDITLAIDNLQQDFRCCGSNSYHDWLYSLFINSEKSEKRLVPDSCCKTITLNCGARDHPSNIFKVEGGCITKLEEFLQEHLLLIGAVSVGIACFQVL
ncbi:tetraspanin-11-like [Bombina bombina]|uniref:tetraspanin-11-like n=1 Tax=Bombina bombina TaxID=8345 RepID=UPI00235A9CD4|nr:tetraspanin-11-like [Bombina bombina]